MWSGQQFGWMCKFLVNHPPPLDIVPKYVDFSQRVLPSDSRYVTQKLKTIFKSISNCPASVFLKSWKIALELKTILIKLYIVKIVYIVWIGCLLCIIFHCLKICMNCQEWLNIVITWNIKGGSRDRVHPVMSVRKSHFLSKASI